MSTSTSDPRPTPGGTDVATFQHDAAVDAFWRRHLRAGLATYAAGTALGVGYLALRPGGPSRLQLAIVAASVITTLAFIALPHHVILRSRQRLRYFVAWSVFTCAFLAVVATADGSESPFVLLLFVPVAYAGLAYTPRAVGCVGSSALGAAVASAVVTGATLHRSMMAAGSLAMVSALAVSTSQQRGRVDAAQRALTDRLQELASVDPLTGLLNRRAFLDRLEHELARVRRHGGTVCVLLADIDHFKSINDVGGHLAGDDVLCQVADSLTAAVRATDTVARIGGDEFAVVLCEADAAAGRHTVARFHAALGAPVTGAGVGVSFGVADTTTASSSRELLAAADAELYLVKALRAAA